MGGCTSLQKNNNEYDSSNEISKPLNFSKNTKHLICDDIYANRYVLGKYLTRFGCKYDEAANGEEAIQKIVENGEYDIIWMDIKMPIMDKCLDVGMNCVLNKPLNKQIIQMHIEKI